MKWIEVKMRELGVTQNPAYKITFFLDSSAMISVDTQKYGVVNVGLFYFFSLFFYRNFVLILGEATRSNMGSF